MVLPLTAAAATVATTVSVALAPEARLPTFQAPSGAVVMTNVPWLGVTESMVTPAGNVRSSMSVTPDASDGPALVTVMTYVRLPAPEPATTLAGPVLVTTRSTSVSTVVVVVAVLLPGVGSVAAEPAVAVLVIVEPSAALELRWTMIEKTADSPLAAVPFVKVIVPVPPTAGVVLVQPAGAAAETNVVPAGITSVIVTVWASLAPLFVKVTVYVRFVPATTGSGESLLVIARSAWALTVVVSVSELLAGVG